MSNNKLQLVPVTRKFTNNTPKGKYPRMVRQFWASGEQEMNVLADDLVNAYMGLRAAVSNLGLRNRVYVQRQDGEVHLIRLG